MCLNQENSTSELEARRAGAAIQVIIVICVHVVEEVLARPSGRRRISGCVPRQELSEGRGMSRLSFRHHDQVGRKRTERLRFAVQINGGPGTL